MMKEILETSEDLGKALQKNTRHSNAIRLVHSTKVLLEEMRSDEGWALFFGNVFEFCMEHDMDIPYMEEPYILHGGHACRQPDHFTTKRYLREEIFRATIGNQLTELNLRFSGKVTDLLSISVAFIPRNGFIYSNAKEICSIVEKYYPAKFTQQERYGLEIHLNHFVVDAKNHGDLKKPITKTFFMSMPC
uniref:Uncharacterized protein n=1 Tax=Hordeum vulgare subsp. vulgare TaxID=112509 RepID=A0A8I6XG12_HORVV